MSFLVNMFILFFEKHWPSPEDLLVTYDVGLAAAASPGSRRSDDPFQPVFLPAPNCCSSASTPSDSLLRCWLSLIKNNPDSSTSEGAQSENASRALPSYEDRGERSAVKSKTTPR